MQQDASVAVLLATYNGGRFVHAQITSLKENRTPFVLHWLDDHSTDDTREAVRTSARSSNIDLRECHQPHHIGYPGSFFRLLKCIEADVYLFCDQDDIWQPGKIDVAVADLLPDTNAPALCFSDPLVFRENRPERLRRMSAITSMKSPAAVQRPGMFMVCPAMGHAIGITRPVRDILLGHYDIACKYAAGHDTWLYLVANATGTTRMLPDAPTTLYRLHGKNTYGGAFNLLGWRSIAHAAPRWRLQQAIRRWVARQATGFCLAAPMLPPGPKLDRLLTAAQLITKLDRRQSLAELVRLARLDAIPPSAEFVAWLTMTCLCSSAKPSTEWLAARASPQ